ncbi:MAG: MFS transporter [Caldanaerobacter sp.]
MLLERRRDKLILLTVMVGAFFSMFDSGIVNVVLPVIAKEFNKDINIIQWVASIYLLTMSALLPILGSIADSVGRRKIYNLGYFIISIFTLFCGLSTNFQMLLVMRVLQGIGGAMVMANGLAIVTENLPASERGKNIGIIVSTMAVGSVFGPPVGGALTSLWGWRSVFILTFVVSFLGFVLSYFTIPKDKKEHKITFSQFDFIGSILLIVTIVSFIYAISSINKIKPNDYNFTISIILFSLTFILFILREIKFAYPVVDLGLFKIRSFTTSIIAALLSFFTMYTPTVLLPFYYQRVIGLPVQKAGLYMMAFPIAMAVSSPFSGKLSDKIGSHLLASSGLVINGIALILLANIKTTTPLILVILAHSLMGLSLGLFQSPNNSCIMGSVPKQKLGIANGITQLIKNLGMVIGISFSTALFTVFMNHSTGTYAARFLSSSSKVYYIAALISFIGAFISFLRPKNEI